MTLKGGEAEGRGDGVESVQEGAFSQRAVARSVDVCEEMAVGWRVVDGEVVLQLGNGIDGPGLGGAVDIFAVLGALWCGVS